jgi:hypothetical protein
MNTPDQAPKDGDFVAYIEELERRQLLAPPPIVHHPTGAQTSKTPTVPVATGAQNAETVATAIKAFPVGLIAIGLVLVIAGALFDGGLLLVALGIFLLWQAVRTVIRSARAAAATGKSQAAQQIASVLAAHAQRKKPAGK